jgi:hypothetical protein
MIFFLRNDKNKTIIEAELYTKDYTHGEDGSYIELSSTVDIENYSHFLLDNQDNKDNIIQIIDRLSELRGWLWEEYFSSERNEYSDDIIRDIYQQVEHIFEEAAKQLNLQYVED